MSTLNDAHCHFFSSRFLELLTQTDPGATAARLAWDPPGSAEALADRWVGELDRHHVNRCSLIASIPGDEESVAAAVARHPSRFVGVFMFNPAAPDAAARLDRALGEQRLKIVALFPAMHRYRLDDEAVTRVFEAAAARGAGVFVHCGVLSVGVRKKLGLASAFDLRLGDPLAVAAVGVRYPTVPIVIPHFGAGFFRETLMAADQCPSIYLDTSSSNSWIKFHAGLTLEGVFRQSIAVVGADRLLFGTDSSFFPRGWQKAIYDQQLAAMQAASISAADQQKILGGNFDRLYSGR
jgi:predicted TIM-barrel fold metal-dependent hydrolase